MRPPTSFVDFSRMPQGLGLLGVQIGQKGLNHVQVHRDVLRLLDGDGSWLWSGLGDAVRVHAADERGGSRLRHHVRVVPDAVRHARGAAGVDLPAARRHGARPLHSQGRC